jgi:hypothetical protein
MSHHRERTRATQTALALVISGFNADVPPPSGNAAIGGVGSAGVFGGADQSASGQGTSGASGADVSGGQSNVGASGRCRGHRQFGCVRSRLVAAQTCRARQAD